MNVSTSLQRDGYAAPVDVLTPQASAPYRARLERFISNYQDHPDYGQWTYFKSHLLLTWVAELAREQKILDAVARILGPDLLLWNSFIPAKHPHSAGHFGWHQDGRFWQIQPLEGTVTVWLALSDVDQSKGGMRVIPGSHKNRLLPHEKTFDPDSMLRRGQKAIHEFDEKTAVSIDLEPGQASIHDPFVLHGSGSNDSDDWRLGVGLNYNAASVSPTGGYQDSALLVRGAGGSTGFADEIAPTDDLSAAALANYELAVQRAATRYEDAQG